VTNYTILIPARLASVRFPKKLLKSLAGKPIIQWTFEQACQTQAKSIYIATDSQEIADIAYQFTPHVLMTDPNHPTGTDRLCEAAKLLDLPDDHIVVNVQGDEPFIPPQIIEQVAQNLAANPEAQIATLYKPFAEHKELTNPNKVKVITDQRGFALYFSRSAIPFDAQGAIDCSLSQWRAVYNHHIGIYAYRVGFLKQFVTWPSCALENFERLEQLRALWYGAKIHVAHAHVYPPQDINTEADLLEAEALMSKQSIDD
jgi:3-deoxy-manno-octulosonate cytidylyltransferase (CMP-KDO synthetase)